MKSIAIVIVNLNGGDMLMETLTSLYDHSKNMNFTLYLVDNHSSDGSGERAFKKFPNIKLLKAKENLGFAKGNNVALNSILAVDKYDYVCLVNPDMLLTENWLKNMVQHLEDNKDVAAINPTILFSEKYFEVPLYSLNEGVFVNASDFRFWKSNLHKSMHIQNDYPSERIRLFENNQYYRLETEQTYVYIPESVNSNNFTIDFWDPEFVGINAKILGKKLNQKRLSSVYKKVNYYFTRELDQAVMSLKLSEKMLSSLKENFEPMHLINSFGGKNFPESLPVDNLYAQKLAELPKEAMEVDYLHGACMFIRTKALKKVGIFDPAYFLYYEDADLSMRIKNEFGKIQAIPNVKIYHREGGNSSEATNRFKQESAEIFRNKWE